MDNFDPETAGNNPDIEKQWAVKALEHAECYMKLISSPRVTPSSLRLTPLDDEIYTTFRAQFPTFNVGDLTENGMNTEAGKAKWREWIKPFENRVRDFNFGTLVRQRANGEGYSEDNAVFVTRIVFFAIEVARNREGYNNSAKPPHDEEHSHEHKCCCPVDHEKK